MEELLTFEKIREIHLNEKNNPKLTQLPEDFFEKVREYLDKKKELAIKRADPKILMEYRNAKRIVEDIFYIRERKLINQVFIYIKTGIMPENMTKEEEEFFFTMVAILKQRRKRVFEEEKEENMGEEVEKDVETEEKVEGSFEEEKVEEKKIEEDEEKNEEPSGIKVLVKMDLPAFIAPNGKEYGPYKEGETVELEEEIAKLLIEKGIAEKVIE